MSGSDDCDLSLTQIKKSSMTLKRAEIETMVHFLNQFQRAANAPDRDRNLYAVKVWIKMGKNSLLNGHEDKYRENKNRK